MSNHKYDAKADRTYCGDFSGGAARAISSEDRASCPDCLTAYVESLYERLGRRIADCGCCVVIDQVALEELIWSAASGGTA